MSNSKLTLVAFQVEGDAAAMETMRAELTRVLGNGGSSHHLGEVMAAAAPMLNGAVQHSQPSEERRHGIPRAPASRGNDNPTSKKQSPTAAAGPIAERILRYMAQSHDNGEPDCTVDDVYRITGSASQDATSACLVKLKRDGLVQAGTKRGQWQISMQGLAHVKQLGLDVSVRPWKNDEDVIAGLAAGGEAVG
jgi:hypothetical protein